MQQISSLIQFLRSKSLFFVSCVIFLCVLGAFYIVDQNFRVKHISVEPQNKRSRQLHGIQNLQGEYIWTVKEQEIAEFIQTRNSYVKQVEVTKTYPDSLLLKIDYYTPLAVLQVPDGYFLLGEEAVILEKNRNQLSPDLPFITYYQNIPFANYQAGQHLNFKDIQDSLFYLKALTGMKIKINSIDIKGFHVLGLNTSDAEYLFSAEKNREQQVYQLETTIREFMISGEKIKSLDVRFDKPVLILNGQ